MNKITTTLQVDHLILEALREDISSEDVTTNSVMREAVAGRWFARYPVLLEWYPLLGKA